MAKKATPAGAGTSGRKRAAAKPKTTRKPAKAAARSKRSASMPNSGAIAATRSRSAIPKV